ncbi:MAG: dihydrodipicolinate synthase family protein [Planctomycetota bacterium]|jgi:4-hydroxy-tetrahydrodipicolinate synthase
MANKILEKPLRGVVPPIITPLSDENTLDADGLTRLIDHILGGGVHGLFLLGTTGEGPSLSVQLKYEMVSESCKRINGRVPVLVGITDTSFSESIRLAEHAASCGVDAVVLAPPYYFPAGQPELLEYLEHLAPRLPLPLFLYNMPAMTKVDICVDTVRKASEIDGIVGFKDSSGNMIRYHEYIKAMRDKPDFSLLVGPEELLGESVLFGGFGGVSGGANIRPALFVKMYDAAVAGDLEAMKTLHREIFDLRELYSIGNYSSTFIKGVKCALNLMGICSDFMAEPFHAFRDTERARVKAILEKLKIN